MVGGVDVSYVGDLGVGAAVVLDYDTLQLLEAAVAMHPVRMPYVPTLLSFRELPPAIAAIKRLKLTPDVFLVDAQGLAHPYRCGFASHLGLAIGKPTIGAAKSRLIGEATEHDGRTVLMDKGEVVGEVVTTKQGPNQSTLALGTWLLWKPPSKLCIIAPKAEYQSHFYKHTTWQPKQSRSSWRVQSKIPCW